MSNIIYCPNCQAEHELGECPLNGKCLYCKVAPATLHFGDLLSLTHGGQLNCCKLCSVRMQLEHAKECAEAIPKLEAQVKELEAE